MRDMGNCVSFCMRKNVPVCQKWMEKYKKYIKKYMDKKG